MFVRNFFLVFFLFFLVTCSIKKGVVNTSIYKANVSICSNPDQVYKLHVSIDSSQNINLRLYNITGFKAVDIIVSQDSSWVKDAFNDEIKKKVQFYLNSYHAKICIHNFILDLFRADIIKNPSLCYTLLKSSDRTNDNFYNINNLNNERIFSLEKMVVSKGKSYRFFNESFCIEVYIK